MACRVEGGHWTINFAVADLWLIPTPASQSPSDIAVAERAKRSEEKSRSRAAATHPLVGAPQRNKKKERNAASSQPPRVCFENNNEEKKIKNQQRRKKKEIPPAREAKKGRDEAGRKSVEGGCGHLGCLFRNTMKNEKRERKRQQNYRDMTSTPTQRRPPRL